MKKTYLILLILSLFLSSSVYAKNPTVSVETIQSTDKYEKGESYSVLFKLTISKEWYIHGTTNEEEYLIPTILSFTEVQGLNISSVQFPEPGKENFDYTSKPVEVYAGTVFVKATVNVENKAITGEQVINGELTYQACSAVSCLAPETVSVKFTISVVLPGTKTEQINREIFLSSSNIKTTNSKYDSGLLWALLWIFLGGLALNLTPCIYPLIPITISYFGGRENKSGADTIFLGILYITGLAVTNSILGVTAALSGGMLGAALQYPIVLIFIALIMVSLGFSFFGFWEIRLPGMLTKVASKNYKGYFGTFFMGLTLGIVAAPCLGPFVLGLLTYVGQKGDPFLGFIYFFVLSLGIGLPLCALAIFSSSIDRLPMSGDWMLWVKKIMGWVLISMGYYFIKSLIHNPLIDHAIFFGISIIAAIHLGWIDKTGSGLKLFRYIKKSVSIIIAILSLLYLSTAIDLRESIQWASYDEAYLNAATGESKPVIMDVYANWCIPCKQMEDKVFKDPEVVRLSKHFVTLRLDITRKQPDEDKIREHYGIDGAPTILFFDDKGNEKTDLRITSKITAKEFISIMKKALLPTRPPQ